MEINLDFYKKMLQNQYGEDLTLEVLNELNKKKRVTLRVNNLRSSKQEIISSLNNKKIEYENVPFYEDAFIIKNESEDVIYNMDIFKQGKIYMQNLSSMIPPLILNPKKGENILDMAAAPGGKTTQIASITNNQAFITACEKNKIRAEKLKYNIEKQGATTVNIMLEDARNLSDYFSFDKILLDAPCSGAGTENIFKKNFTLDLIQKSCKIQEKLLQKALKILKPGGELIYSTCSILRQENEEIISKCLKNTNAYVVPINDIKGVYKLPTVIEGTLCVKPNDLYEGFFIAKIHKN